MKTDLDKTANALVADGKGILAADETPATLTKRFETHKIASTPESRRDYREMFFTTLSLSYGCALQDEALQAWLEKPQNRQAGQQAFGHRAKCASAAALGKYTRTMEGGLAV